jgi:hypothetical protein
VTPTPTSEDVPGPWHDGVDASDWSSIGADLDNYGCALTGPLLSPAETHDMAALYAEASRFRSTIDMARYRFGEGEYRYFAERLSTSQPSALLSWWCVGRRQIRGKG